MMETPLHTNCPLHATKALAFVKITAAEHDHIPTLNLVDARNVGLVNRMYC